jgi:hypothetical protein
VSILPLSQIGRHHVNNARKALEIGSDLQYSCFRSAFSIYEAIDEIAEAVKNGELMLSSKEFGD